MRKFLLITGLLLSLCGPAWADNCVTYPFPTGCTLTAQSLNTALSSLRGASVLAGKLISANFNTTVDQQITLTIPTANWQLQAIVICNPSTSMTTAVGGFYTGQSKSGTAVVAAAQGYSALTTNTLNATGSCINPVAGAGTTQWLNVTTLYLSLTTPQGGTATADVYVYARLLQ